jgi:inorganic pyrophosphatase
VAKKRLPMERLEPRIKGKTLRIVVETPKGSRNKFDFDPKLQLFKLGSVLPVGETFPYDFGFVPKTRGEDGDPLDVMILMDEPAFPGCVMDVRLVGVIKASQSDGKKKYRNDRLVAVACESHVHRHVKTLSDVDGRLLDEIEEFFEAYNEMKGETFKPLGRSGPKVAQSLLRKGMRAASA